MTPEEDHVLRGILLAVIWVTIMAFAPQIKRFLQRIGYTGTGLGKDKPADDAKDKAAWREGN